jgi:predicted CopG family antitoxin
LIDDAQCMYVLRMATKTISVHLDAYERLKAARRSPDESFSQVILRASWPEKAFTARELLERLRKHGPFFTDAELDAIEEAKDREKPPVNKWRAS